MLKNKKAIAPMIIFLIVAGILGLALGGFSAFRVNQTINSIPMVGWVLLIFILLAIMFRRRR